jgi:16S rRNA (guanine527-N7)-methyltransferase
MIRSEEEARAYCATLTDAAGLAGLERFATLLAEENRRQNLVSGASLEQVWQRHIADSLQLLGLAEPEGSPWLDLGTGAGPPGLLIAIARPEWPVRLIESRKRRVEWLAVVASELGLMNCVAVADRLEDVPAFETKVISARAFAPLDKLLRLSARFSTPDTVWLLPKGRSAAKELGEQKADVRAMFHVEQSLTDPQAGILVGRGRPAGA